MPASLTDTRTFMLCSVLSTRKSQLSEGRGSFLLWLMYQELLAKFQLRGEDVRVQNKQNVFQMLDCLKLTLGKKIFYYGKLSQFN